MVLAIGMAVCVCVCVLVYVFLSGLPVPHLKFFFSFFFFSKLIFAVVIFSSLSHSRHLSPLLPLSPQ